MKSSRNAAGRPARLLLATVALAAALAGCNRLQSTETLLQEARQALDKGDRSAAAIHLKNVLQKEPDNGQARFLLGKIYYENGDGPSAEKELRRALELKVEPVKVWPVLAKAMLQTQNLKQIVEQMPIDASYPAPVRAELLAVRATALLFQAKVDDAQAGFEAALQADPNSDGALFGLARIAAMRRDLDKAVALVSKVLEKTPKHSEALLFRSDLERVKGDLDKAAASAMQAVEAEPRNTRARLVAGNLALAQGKIDEAAKQAAEIKKISANSPAGLYLSALVHARKKEYTLAQEEIQKALRAAPQHLPSLLLAGAISYSSGAYNQAEQHLKEVLRLAPNTVYAKKMLAALYVRTQRPARAVEVLVPLEQSGEPDIHALLGEAYMQLGEFQKATVHYGKAAEADPKSAASRTGLAMSKLASGDTDRALSELESAVKLESDNTQADVLLVLSRVNRGEYDKAMAAIDELEKKVPKTAQPNVLRSHVALAKKDTAQARKYLDSAEKIAPNDFQVVYALARLDQQEGKLDDARKRMQVYVEKNDKNVEATIALAELKTRLNAPRQEVIELLKRASAIDPRLSRPMEILARYYLAHGMTKEALEIAQKAQSVNPDAPSVLDALGAAQLMAGDANQAMTTYSRLAAVQPTSALPLIRLAQAQEATGNRAAALGTAVKAAELDPDSAEALELAVTLRLYSQQPAQALALAQKAQKAHPKQPLGYMLEGDVLVADKRPLEAVSRYDQAYKLVASPLILMRKHRALMAGGKQPEAQKLLLEALSQFPKDISLRLYAGDVAISTKQYAAAVDYLKKVIEIQPNNVIALNNLGWALHQSKDPQAITFVEQALKNKPDHPAILDTYGVILKDSGQADKAVQNLQKATTLAPNDPSIRLHYAAALVAAGQKESARRELETLKKLGTRFGQAAEVEAMLKQL